MKHLDLFSGIGGFALALDQVVKAEHVFCDNDPFCQEVLKKNFPNTKIYGDIREIKQESADIVTGGFPCQPFSSAGKKQGINDIRWLWPEMFAVIRSSKPQWVIAENVSGLLTWGGGMAFEQVCLDLEAEGYEVQPFVIPACAKNAWHRRDRVWIIGHSKYFGCSSPEDRKRAVEGNNSHQEGQDKVRQFKGSTLSWDTQWKEDWFKVASELCGIFNGVSNKSHRIKALGNAIVPQVAEEIMRGMFL